MKSESRAMTSRTAKGRCQTETLGQAFLEVEVGGAEDAVPNRVFQPSDAGLRERVVDNRVDQNKVVTNFGWSMAMS